MNNRLFTGIRLKLFRLIHNGTKKFNVLKSKLNKESNEISYHLNILLKSGLIEKKIKNSGIEYVLSENGKVMYPYLSILAREQNPLFVVTSVLVMSKNKDKAYLQKKPREPDKGKLIFFGGKANPDFSIENSARKQVKAQSGLDIHDLKLRCVNEFIVRQSDSTIVHNWVVYFYTALTSGKPKKNVVSVKMKELETLELYGENSFFAKKIMNSKKARITKTVFDSKDFELKKKNIFFYN